MMTSTDCRALGLEPFDAGEWQFGEVVIGKSTNNGAFAVVYVGREPAFFLRDVSIVLCLLLRDLEGDWEFTLEGLLPQIASVWAYLCTMLASEVVIVSDVRGLAFFPVPATQHRH